MLYNSRSRAIPTVSAGTGLPVSVKSVAYAVCPSVAPVPMYHSSQSIGSPEKSLSASTYIFGAPRVGSTGTAGTAGTTACAVVAMGMLSVTMTFCIVVWTFTTCPLARNVPSLANLRLSRIEELGSNWTMSASSRTERLSVFVRPAFASVSNSC